MPRVSDLHRGHNTRFYTDNTLWFRSPQATSRLGLCNSLEATSRTAATDSTTGRSSFLPRRGVGNFYEIVGSLQTGYFTQQVVNNRHSKWDTDERGSHLVGCVAPDYLGTLEGHFSLVPIQQRRPDCNCQTWVVEALKGLDQTHNYAVEMEYTQWFQQMSIVEKA